jgi:hypothetical protein
VGYVAGDNVIVHCHVVETVDDILIRDCFGQFCLAAAEVADDIPASLLAPADHLLVGYNRPIFAGLTIEGVVLSPLLGVRLKALINSLAVALVSGAVHG